MPLWIVKQEWHIYVDDDLDDDEQLDAAVEALISRNAELIEEEMYAKDE
jgi:hypothetical protein